METASRLTRSWRVAVLILPLLLLAVRFALDPLGAECSDDFLDNPDYSCNLGGEIAWAMYIAIPVAVIAALVVLVTWPSSGPRRPGSRR